MTDRFSVQSSPQSSEKRQVIDDEQLKRMMKANEPSFMEKYGSCIVTLVLIAIC